MPNEQYKVGEKVTIRDEYSNHPVLHGQTKGTIVRSSLLGTVMVYTLALENMKEVTATHDSLLLTQ